MITQSSPNSNSTGSAPARDTELEKIKTIREILVGEQIQGVNDRFQNLEKSLEAHYAKLVNQLMAKFEAVQTLGKAEVDNLRKSVEEQVFQLRGDDATLSDQIKAARGKLSDLEKKQDEMKVALADQVRKMYEEFTKQMSEFSRLVKQQHEDLSKRMIPRNDLANLLHGMASSISPAGNEQQKGG